MKRVTHYTGGQTIDYITKTRLASPKSHRPLHDLAMCSEAVRVGQMIYVLQKQRATIHEIKTDSCLYRPLKRARPCLETLAYKDLRVRDIFEPAGQRRLDEAHRLTIHGSEQYVYRVAPAVEKDLMRMVPQMPERSVSIQILPRIWKDLNEEDATQAVYHGGSLLVNGIAGTGKTHFMKTLVARLRTDGKRVDCISKTHTASERMGGVTADHYVRRHILHGSCTCHVLWIDEISQLDCALWAQLNKLDVQFLLSGDFNQFDA
jgi:hypothetical protein